MRILAHLVVAIRGAAVYNPDVQVAPACILWPDKNRLWEPVMPLVQAELPELLSSGSTFLIKKTGPANWLRCMLAGDWVRCWRGLHTSVSIRPKKSGAIIVSDHQLIKKQDGNQKIKN